MGWGGLSPPPLHHPRLRGFGSPGVPAGQGGRKAGHAALAEEPFNFDKNEVQNRGQFSFLPIREDLCQSGAGLARGGGQAGWLRVLGRAPSPGRATGHPWVPASTAGRRGGRGQLAAGLAGVKRGACEAGEEERRRRRGEAAREREPERARRGTAGLRLGAGRGAGGVFWAGWLLVSNKYQSVGGGWSRRRPGSCGTRGWRERRRRSWLGLGEAGGCLADDLPGPAVAHPRL